MPLLPRLSFDPEETLLSYTDRLSVMHTGRGMERLLKDLGIHREHFVSGRSDTVTALAVATGHSVEELEATAIRVFPRASSFRGQEMSKTFLSPRAARYCPICLAEDGEKNHRRFRLLWGFRHVARCDLHSILLEAAPVANGTNLRVSLDGASLAKPVAAEAIEPEYLRWLRNRLDGSTRHGDSWMDDQTTEQVLAAAEMLGATLEHGHRVAVTRLTSAQTEEATDIGFSIYREGPRAVEEALDAIRQRSPAKAVQAGALAHYGKLFDWLDRRSNAVDPGPIRDILRNHIVKHSAVEPGTTVLGVEINRRRFHTVHSLSSEVGIEYRRLSRLLKSLGQVPEHATEVQCGNMVFDAAKAVPLIQSFKTAVPLMDVPEYIGASKGQVEILYRVGLIKPLIPRTGRGSVRRVVFARQHLDNFLAKISALPEFTLENANKLHPIAFACQRGAGPFEKVFNEIMVGTIPSFRHPEKIGVGAVYVHIADALAAKIPA